MAIKVECGDCGKNYSVKDELVGKKIRCKECSAVIPVRAQVDDDWDEEEEEDFLPPVRKSTKKKARRRSSSDGMPPTVIIALICVGLMIALSLLSIVGLVVLFTKLISVPPQFVGMVLVGLLQVGIQLAVLMGIIHGTASTRMISIVLAVLASLVIGALLTRAPQQMNNELVVPLLLFGLFLRAVFIGCMFTPSANDHMRR